jgi:hypothetical protein
MEDDCTEDCTLHRPECDGFCHHTENHQNWCIIAPYIGL